MRLWVCVSWYMYEYSVAYSLLQSIPTVDIALYGVM